MDLHLSAKRTLLWMLVGASVAYAAYDVYMYSLGEETAPDIFQLWQFAFLWLVVAWIDVDSRSRREIYRPFEYTFLAFYFAPFYVPYYLIRTRRAVGVGLLIGLLCLFLLGFLAKLGIYYVG